MKSVFISYSARDKEFARKLAADLAQNGISPWIDEREIQVGDSLVEKISEGIKSADFVLAILSGASVRSRWVQEEIKAAIAKDPQSASRVVIPVLIEDVDIPPFVRNIKYVDLTSTPYREGLKQILQAVLDLPPQDTPKLTRFIDVSDLAKEVAIEVAHILKISPEGMRESVVLGANIDPKLVFVIMAIMPDMEPVFDGIRAAGEAHGLSVERVKDLPGDYRITNKIVEMIHKAYLVVADLTHERPNVYFELGYARGLSKTIITTARDGTPLHFDVKDWTCTFYNDSRVLERHLHERFSFELKRL